jgi:hypothetical protein
MSRSLENMDEVKAQHLDELNRTKQMLKMAQVLTCCTQAYACAVYYGALDPICVANCRPMPLNSV